jgi:hypothetical protein
MLLGQFDASEARSISAGVARRPPKIGLSEGEFGKFRR